MVEDGLGELEKLTAGETLIIDRRRRGERQPAAAERLGVSVTVYGRWENEKVKGDSVPYVAVLPLKAHERCLLYRRRVGKTQPEVAEELGCCGYWLKLMELGQVNCDKLLWFWEQ